MQIKQRHQSSSKYTSNIETTTSPKDGSITNLNYRPVQIASASDLEVMSRGDGNAETSLSPCSSPTGDEDEETDDLSSVVPCDQEEDSIDVTLCEEDEEEGEDEDGEKDNKNECCNENYLKKN